ncbi:MAG TPA: R3H domain-containing nucleic acid-binding protein [Terriglobales bacterium]|jgi:spoIIIJ-associated protein|nr:R3H domain-containing nucleic acid-binding protein [Terriglobales bacterium]
MSEGRRPAGKRPPPRGTIKETPRAEAHFDRARAVEQLKRYLDLCVREMGLELEYEISAPANAEGGSQAAPSGIGAEVVVAFRGADEALLLEHDAELLLALEQIAHRWLRLDPRLHDHVRFDCGDYRTTRLDELKLSARVAAQRVRETGQPFRFNPMSPRERRLIHLELNGAAGVRTMSEGAGDHRQLVIYPANKK